MTCMSALLSRKIRFKNADIIGNNVATVPHTEYAQFTTSRERLIVTKKKKNRKEVDIKITKYRVIDVLFFMRVIWRDFLHRC